MGFHGSGTGVCKPQKQSERGYIMAIGHDGRERGEDPSRLRSLDEALKDSKDGKSITETAKHVNTSTIRKVRQENVV